MRIMLVVLTVMLVGCSGGSDNAEATPKTIAEIAAAIPCSPSVTAAEAFVSEQAFCDDAGEHLEIVMLSDARQWYTAIERVACPAFDVPAFYSVDGGNWAISTETQQAADRLADVLNAKSRTVHC